MRVASLLLGSWHAVNLVLIVWTVWVGRTGRGERLTLSAAMALDGAPWVNMLGLLAWGLTLLTLVLPVMFRRFGSAPGRTVC